MIAMAAGLFVFLALSTGAVLALAPARWRRSAPDERVRALRPALAAEGAGASAALGLRRSRSSIPTLRRWLNDSAWAEAATTDLQQANIRLRAGEYLLIRLLVAVFLLGVPLVVLGGNVAGLVLAAIGGVAGYLAPAFYVKHARGRRIARIEKQLIEFLPALSSSLRSGFAFQPAVEAALQQVDAPLAGELTTLLNDMSLGAAAPDALQELGRRVGSPDLDMVITAILVQRTTGGNLPEILDGTAEALRERERIRGEIQTFTAQQRLTGLILSIYPIAVGLLLLAIMPSIWSRLFTEPVGQVQLIIALTLQVVGFIAIRRALRIEV